MIFTTGNSTGIGYACAIGMKARSWRVFATARKSEHLARHEAEGLEALYVDSAQQAAAPALRLQ